MKNLVFNPSLKNSILPYITFTLGIEKQVQNQILYVVEEAYLLLTDKRTLMSYLRSWNVWQAFELLSQAKIKIKRHIHPL